MKNKAQDSSRVQVCFVNHPAFASSSSFQSILTNEEQEEKLRDGAERHPVNDILLTNEEQQRKREKRVW